IRERLVAEGWPVGDLAFQPNLVMRGLIIDKQLGNVVKANRFGYVRKAFHGTQPLPFKEERQIYQRTLIDLEERRWLFLNTLFSISEACMYMQLVDLLDQGKLTPSLGYADLYTRVRRSLDEAHMEGRLKAEIIADPERFVDLDEEMPLALLDQKEAGKKILLITNSEWSYAAPMLSYVFDPFLPGSLTWRDLFDIAIVAARKPAFFTHQMPGFRVASEDGLLREHVGPLESGHVYVGGNAQLVQESLGLAGEEILYVGDHIFVDVNVSKNVLRWRTALVLRELEDEIAALATFEDEQARLNAMMAEKAAMESDYAALRLDLQRARKGYGPDPGQSADRIEEDLARLRQETAALDAQIAPLAQAAGRLLNPNWGPLMRTGNDKSHLARQVERYADVYTARVSNFLAYTPFAYLRSHRGSMPHDDASHWQTATDVSASL
ncbi:MAG: HAD-IG family 5'-nucleotidase, partial [Rhodothermales bacterium]